ncbi:threonine/homoserine/homoserine lactone efflux protein [Hamadaea flava]|uniref:LysE family translocator n=1 Tax=Hamadaea flava TaxID=1742688 RepID=A0ABV8LU91_9ACTN|nr:LysE family translocator [Hamadaea flava]MCP2327546.1 threonine/homoserine/homoserine lactone efflux protein [Hamadaea flava]
MISTGAVLGVALVELTMVAIPGPNMFYLVSRTLAQGRTAGLTSLLGTAAGFGVYLLATAAGLVAVFAAVPVLYTALKVSGAAYLLYLAFQALRGRKGSPFESQQLPNDPTWRLFTMGLLTNLLNPKIAMIYVALLPQFIEPARGHVAVQAVLLGLVQIAIALIGNGLIVLAAGKVATFLAARPRWIRVQRYLMASVLGVLAVRMLADRARPLSA